MSLAEMSEEREGDEAPFLVDVYDEYILEEFVLNGDPVEYETVIDGQRHSSRGRPARRFEIVWH